MIETTEEWSALPSLLVNGQKLVIRGKWLRIASLKDEEWSGDAIVDPEACIAELKQCGRKLRADIFSFIQQVPQTAPLYPYPAEPASIAVADLGDYEAWWMSLPHETRKNVRRSQKRGITIETRRFDDDLVRGILAIQNEVPIRQGKRYPHYGKTFEQVRRDHGVFLDRSDLICAYYQGELVGFLSLVHCGRSGRILQLLSKREHYDKRPANALVAKAAELCAARGIRYLVYGKFHYRKNDFTSLLEFKMRHGFREMLAPQYFIPLTRRGAVCRMCGWHRGMIGVLPGPVAASLRKVRKAWYNSRLQSEREKD